MAVPAALRKGSKRGAAEGEKVGALVHFFLRASEFVRNFESRKPLEIRNLTRIRSSPIDGTAAASGGGAGFVGNVGRPQGREGWGENGVDDRAVVGILPANLNPPLFPPTSRKALERSSFTAVGRVRLKAEGRFVQALTFVYPFRRRGWRCDLFVQATGHRVYLLFAPPHFLNARFQTSPPANAPSYFRRP